MTDLFAKPVHVLQPSEVPSLPSTARPFECPRLLALFLCFHDFRYVPNLFVSDISPRRRMPGMIWAIGERGAGRNHNLGITAETAVDSKRCVDLAIHRHGQPAVNSFGPTGTLANTQPMAMTHFQ